MVRTGIAGDPMAARSRTEFRAQWPSTTLGRWSMWMAAGFVVLFAINMVFVGTSSSEMAASQTWRQSVLPFYGIGMLLVGFASGVVAVVAILRQGERSVVTLLTTLPMLFVAFMLIGELLVPH